MEYCDVHGAIAEIKYKPGSTIELAPAGRIPDPLRIIIKLTLVDAISGRITIKIHSSEIPPADYIKDIHDLMRHIRNVIRIAEAHENDQWLQIAGNHPFRGRGNSQEWAQLKLAGHN